MVDQVKSNVEGQIIDKPENDLELHPQIQAHIDAFNTLLDVFSRGYIVSGLEGNYIYVSPNIEKYIGIPSSELVGKRPSDFSVSSQSDEIIQQIKKTVESGEPQELEFEVTLNKTGKSMILKKITKAIKDTKGKVVGIISIFEDVTDMKKNKIKEIEQELFFKEAEESAGAGAYRVFLDTGVWIGSQNLCKIFGIEVSEKKRNDEEFFSFVHPDDKSMLIDYYSDIMSGKIPEFDKEYRIVRQDNQEIRRVHGKGKVKKDEQSGKLMLSGIIIDTTEKKRDQVELRKVTNLLLAIKNGTTDFLSTIGLDGKFTFVNPSLANFLGLSESEINGKTMCEILEIDSTPLREAIEKIIQTKSHVLNEEEVTNKAGEKKILSIMRGPIFDSEGNVNGVFSICRDITDIRKKENELNETQKQLKLREKMAIGGEILAGVAHDLNNILTPIMGYADMALLSEGLPDTIIEYLKNVKRASIRARDLVTQLKQMTKNTNIEKSDFDIYEVISEVFKLLINTTNRLVDKQILIDKGLHNIIGNKSELHQVFMNLGVNSIQAMAERGIKDGDFIKVVAENTTILKDNSFGIQEGNYVHITFEDNGCGMTPEVLEKAFSPFFTTKGNGGTGIGLATVFNIIVQNHNGAIYIDSIKDVGTKIHIYLPSTNQNEWINNDRKVEILGGSETILIIDDEELICKMLKDLLERLGYKIIVAKNGREGLNIIKSNPNIDLISLDLDMPGMSGNQLLESLPEGFKAKILVSSGYSQSLKPSLLPKIGGLVDKPFNINKITTKIRKLLDK